MIPNVACRPSRRGRRQARTFIGHRPACFAGALGGEYGGGNLATVPLAELIGASGSMAQPINGLPEGDQVKLSVVE